MVEVDFLVAVAVPVPFFALACELLEVVVMVSFFLVAQEERKAMPIKATVKERMVFFIGWLLTTLPDRQPRPLGQAKSADYSARNATIGLTRVARRAGTKIEAAATSASNPATAK